MPLDADDYIELLPVQWRTINSYGIRINHRTYDAKALNPHRRQHSGVDAHNGKWEVHYDPYDVSRIWVRNHHDDGWLAATWTHLRGTPVPFDETLWRHARTVADRRGTQKAREADIAAIAEDLMDRAAAGPTDQSKAERRVTGRTSAASAGRTWPTPPPSSECDASSSTQSAAHGAVIDDDQEMAEVIPLPVFDARKEAQTWRL